MVRILNGISLKFRRWIHWLWQHEGTTGQRARGLAAGVFSGCFPLFGLQTLLGIALASLIQGNHFLAASGTWISNPFTYLPLYWFNYQVGCGLIGNGGKLMEPNVLNVHMLLDQGSLFFSRLLLGSTLVGTISASLTYLIIYKILQKKSKKI